MCYKHTRSSKRFSAVSEYNSALFVGNGSFLISVNDDYLCALDWNVPGLIHSNFPPSLLWNNPQ